MTAAVDALGIAGVAEPIGMVVDAGYWSEHGATVEWPPHPIAIPKGWEQRRAARELGTTTGVLP